LLSAPLVDTDVPIMLCLLGACYRLARWACRRSLAYRAAAWLGAEKRS